jgi:hypothetical protein
MIAQQRRCHAYVYLLMTKLFSIFLGHMLSFQFVCHWRAGAFLAFDVLLRDATPSPLRPGVYPGLLIV